MVIRETIKTPTPANRRFLESAGGTTPGEFILTSRLLDRVYHDSLEILRGKSFGGNFLFARRTSFVHLVLLLDHASCTLSFSFCRLERLIYVHSRPWSRTKSITGYSVTRRCVLRPSVERRYSHKRTDACKTYVDVHGRRCRIVIRNLPEHSPSNSRYSRSVSSSYTRHSSHRSGQRGTAV